MAAGGIAAVKIDHLKEIAVFQANVYGVEKAIVLHDVGEQLQGIRIDFAIAQQLRIPGQQLGNMKGVGIDGVEVAAGVFRVVLIFAEGGFNGDESWLGDQLHGSTIHKMGSQELFLSRLAQGIPNQSI